MCASKVQGGGFFMGILYNVPDLKTWGFMAFVLLALIAFNELG